MQITGKLRNAIILALTKLTRKEADKIASACNVSRDTVYRTLRRLNDLEAPVESDNLVVIELGELAAKKKKEVDSRHNRLAVLTRQLSA
jgi:hypothetical protein